MDFCGFSCICSSCKAASITQLSQNMKIYLSTPRCSEARCKTYSVGISKNSDQENAFLFLKAYEDQDPMRKGARPILKKSACPSTCLRNCSEKKVLSYQGYNNSVISSPYCFVHLFNNETQEAQRKSGKAQKSSFHQCTKESAPRPQEAQEGMKKALLFRLIRVESIGEKGGVSPETRRFSFIRIAKDTVSYKGSAKSIGNNNRQKRLRLAYR